MSCSRTVLYNAEAKGVIPKSKRIKEGSLNTRYWDIQDLPIIGEKFGYLKKPNNTKIISIYTPKGGVLKSTIAYNLARILALHNVKTLVIGLDIQGTITELLTATQEREATTDDLDSPHIENLTRQDLYCLSTQQKKFGEILFNTDLPSLKYIPETTNLNFLEKKIREVTKREFYFKTLLQPHFDEFDVIIFDNSPNWNYLIQNSLSIATDVISPISCEVNTFHSIAQNINIIKGYESELELNWNNFILVPTKVSNTKISREIEARYRTMSKLVTNTSIRMASDGDKSNLNKQSVFETVPGSAVTDDYKSLIKELWLKIVT